MILFICSYILVFITQLKGFFFHIGYILVRPKMFVNSKELF